MPFVGKGLKLLKPLARGIGIIDKADDGVQAVARTAGRNLSTTADATRTVVRESEHVLARNASDVGEGITRLAGDGFEGGLRKADDVTGLARPAGSSLEKVDDVGAASKLSSSAEDVVGQVDDVVLKRLEQGADVEIPPGTKGIRKMMSDMTTVSGNEVALIRLESGRRVLRMGIPNAVNVSGAKRVIAHTHPKGSLRFSEMDIRALTKRGQHSSVIIAPREDFGLRIPVPRGD